MTEPATPTTPQGATWVRPCVPGPRPTWVAPATETGELLVTWAEPSEMRCVDCAWDVGPEDVGVDEIPFEIIRTKGTRVGTKVSMLDVLGEATWMVAQLARLRGKNFGLCFERLRPPCSCGCPSCMCGAVLDRTWVPDDTQQVVRVLVDGFEIPQFMPAPVVTPVTQPAGATATVAWATHGFTVTGVAPGTTTMTWTIPGPGNVAVTHSTTIVCSASPDDFVGANSSRVVVRPGGGLATWTAVPRANWELRVQSTGKRWLTRLDPFASCRVAASSCGCVGENAAAAPRWPNRQRIDLEATEECTWAIEVLRGEAVPPLGRLAVCDLACELARRVVGDPCRVPPEVTALVRGGATIDMKRIRNLSGFTEGWGIDSLRRFIELSCAPQTSFIDMEGSDPFAPWALGTPVPAWPYGTASWPGDLNNVASAARPAGIPGPLWP